ncbi:hypothetical protein KRR26_04675 [Corallococcus sp. M34]|uniref:hypothetical protein n=1 Tax=Citreicoccus inhibens TaxID=2849499 RepID=UPI0011C4AD33|nr:hypothetical protein [Citreicoccus inhibens]MBU8894883.1 hypothetical protein [Citreicoccus inhibens]
MADTPTRQAERPGVRRARPLAWALLAGGVLVVGAALGVTYQEGTVISVQVSPDGNFQLERAVLWSFPPRFLHMTLPGDGGDTYSPGYVRLRDAHGRKLDEVFTDAIGLVDRVEWTPTSVSFVYTREDLHFIEWVLAPN